MNIGDVVSGRAKLKGIRWALLSVTAHKVLADQLRALLPDGAAVGPCLLREARFKPGRKITAYYDALVNTENPEGHHVRPIAVTWRPSTRADRNAEHEETLGLAKIQAEAVRHGVAAPFLGLMADLPEWNMHIRVSPLDPRFTQLVRVSDPLYVRAMLEETYAAGNAAWHQHRISDYTVTSIKYRPGKRHVLRYDPRDPVTGAAVFAKLYICKEEARASRREDGARAFRVAQGIADWLAERGQGVNSLRPLGYVAQDAVVLYPQLCGVPLSDYTRRLNRVAARCLHQAGVAVCALHHLPVALAGRPERHDFAAEIRWIVKKSHHIPALLPEVGSAIAAVLDRARELHERLPQEPATFTHRDLKTEHIWVASDGLTVMDFDSSRPADPALDVGYFLADLQFRHAAWPQAGLEKARESFLAGYAPGAPKERLTRARLYEAVKLVKCAVRRVQVFEPDWASRTAGLVERAQAVINDLERILGLPVRICPRRPLPLGASVSLTRVQSRRAGT